MVFLLLGVRKGRDGVGRLKDGRAVAVEEKMADIAKHWTNIKALLFWRAAQKQVAEADYIMAPWPCDPHSSAPRAQDLTFNHRVDDSSFAEP
jgi:hypothetical protein